MVQSKSIRRGWRCYETLLYVRNWLANDAEWHSVSAGMYALQTAINWVVLHRSMLLSVSIVVANEIFDCTDMVDQCFRE